MFVEQQRIELISLDRLRLWSENPREPFSDSKIGDLSIIRHALEDQKNKWDLAGLAEKMGKYYDLSELPIVVWQDDVPVVYDGNRRVILAKLASGCAGAMCKLSFDLPEVPPEMPCCVCSREVALESVWRKHAFNSSWNQLERDIFECKFMGKPASTFKMIDDATNGLISRTPKLNQGYVKKEVLTESNLKAVGIGVSELGMVSRHSSSDTEKILEAIVKVVDEKQLTTRGGNRGDLEGAIRPIVGGLLDAHKYDPYKPVSPFVLYDATRSSQKSRRTPRVQDAHQFELFGGTLSLRGGVVNNLYRDICSLDEYYHKNHDRLSATFHALIRMSLRLLCEAMSGTVNTKDLCDYARSKYEDAKKLLSQEAKTFLRTKTVDDRNFPQLLQTAGHNYMGMSDYQQTVAMSLIIGKMLEMEFAKEVGADLSKTQKEESDGDL